MFKNINIIKFFFEKPTREFKVREIGRLTSVAAATKNKELKKLERRSFE